MRMRVLFATPLHATLVGLAGGGGTGKSHTFRRRKMEAGSEREGRPVCEEAISPSSVGDSNPLLAWDLGVSDCLTTVSACLPACPPSRPIDRSASRRGCICRLCDVCRVFIWNNVLRPPLIKSRVWAKREERQNEGGRGRRRMTVDVEEIVMPPPPPMKKKRERASERQREGGIYLRVYTSSSHDLWGREENRTETGEYSKLCVA